MGLEFREKLPERVPDTLLVYRLAEPTPFPSPPSSSPAWRPILA